jgi:hypothetical protein
MAEGSSSEATNPLIRRARDALSGASQNPNREPEAAPSGATPARISPLGRSLTDATNKISEIVDAAERVAHEIQADAENEARNYLEDRRQDADALVVERSAELSELTQSLTKKVEKLRNEVESMVKDLDQTVERMRGLSGPQPGSGDAEPGPRTASSDSVQPASGSEPIPRPVAYQGTARHDAAAAEADSDAQKREHAMLRATQLAVAGTSRGEIEDTLEREFGIADAGSVVDEILGPAA